MSYKGLDDIAFFPFFTFDAQILKLTLQSSLTHTHTPGLRICCSLCLNYSSKLLLLVSTYDSKLQSQLRSHFWEVFLDKLTFPFWADCSSMLPWPRSKHHDCLSVELEGVVRNPKSVASRSEVPRPPELVAVSELEAILWRTEPLICGISANSRWLVSELKCITVYSVGVRIYTFIQKLVHECS